MSFVKNKHNDIFKKNIINLFDSMGENVYVYLRNSGRTVCTWCLYDDKLGRSSGQPCDYITEERRQDITISLGFDLTPAWLGQWLMAEISTPRDWTIHPNYNGGLLVCPECNGHGYTNLFTTIALDDVIVQDRDEEIIDRVSGGILYGGIKILQGKLNDVLSNISDINSDSIFEKASKIIVRGEDYQLQSLNRLGLKDLYIYEATLSRNLILENNT